MLHKGAFRDMIALRYDWLPSNLPSNYPCGSSFTMQHALSCPSGGFPILRHYEVRDQTANLVAEVCHDKGSEHHLQPITGDTLAGASATSEDGARLDIAASGFWGGRPSLTSECLILLHRQTTNHCLLLQKAPKHQEEGLQTACLGNQTRFLHT